MLNEGAFDAEAHPSHQPSVQRKEAAMELIPQVVQALAGPNYSVYIYFHDGTVRLLDAACLEQKGRPGNLFGFLVCGFYCSYFATGPF